MNENILAGFLGNETKALAPLSALCVLCVLCSRRSFLSCDLAPFGLAFRIEAQFAELQSRQRRRNLMPFSVVRTPIDSKLSRRLDLARRISFPARFARH